MVFDFPMRPSTPLCHQINLQRQFGGGEVYTGFLSRALLELGVPTRLYVHPEAHFWPDLLPAGIECVPVANEADLPALLVAAPPGWLLAHGGLAVATTEALRQRMLTVAICHMPRHQRDSAQYRAFDLVCGVSAYVIDGLRAAGVKVWEQALFGVASTRDGPSGGGPSERPLYQALYQALYQGECYDWDRRKLRDRLFGLAYAVSAPLRRQLARPIYHKRPGLTLGVVSRLTTIKQFPALFTALLPHLAQHGEVNIEIFGRGGYASVRDLRQVLAPLGARVRFWGHQQEVASVYAQLDYLLTGLPEQEALGLNVIEAQACGLPVLAVAAPPFSETVLDGQTGYLYTDPRLDQGAAFNDLLDGLLSGQRPRPIPALAVEHLQRFTAEAFTARLGHLLAHLAILRP